MTIPVAFHVMNKISHTIVHVVKPGSDWIPRTCRTKTCTGMKRVLLVKNVALLWWINHSQPRIRLYFVHRVMMPNLQVDVMLVEIHLDQVSKQCDQICAPLSNMWRRVEVRTP